MPVNPVKTRPCAGARNPSCLCLHISPPERGTSPRATRRKAGQIIRHSRENGNPSSPCKVRMKSSKGADSIFPLHAKT